MRREMLLEEDYDYMNILERSMSPDMFSKLMRIKDPQLHRWIADIIRVAQPKDVFVISSENDFEFIRRKALENKEELPTLNPKHTVHFDGPNDLARDRKNTKILIPSGERIPYINTLNREEGLREIKSLLPGIMKGKTMFIGFYCFGPRNSPFTMYAVQITDSAYVVHNENIMYRLCYDEFVKKAPNLMYARFLHSVGERDENGWAKNIDRRRIYIDLQDFTVYTTNTQYGGNTIGLKKPMLRLCIYKGYLEGWLCEHMFIAGIKGPNNRITYLTGAFPAGCGKTSTTFTSDTIVGDDLAIIRNVDGIPRAVNPEVGMFGMIDGVNPRDDPLLYDMLINPDYEVIFSNVLLTKDGRVWWNGKDEEPSEGINYAGPWWPGKRDENGRVIKPSHPNARFTISLRNLKILDPHIDDPMGVPISAMLFGGRDSDTWVPVEEAFNWVHGVITKAAALESEKTAAILEKAGVREFNPFAILDFLPISIGKFIDLHLKFAERLRVVPKIFSVNYFLKDEKGRYLTEKTDKKVWLKWIELRVHNEVKALETPTGLIPTYEDLVKLFDKYLGKEYPEELYVKEFTLRVPQHLEKIKRIWRIYEGIMDTPKVLFTVLKEQEKRLKNARNHWGDFISPFKFDRR